MKLIDALIRFSVVHRIFVFIGTFVFVAFGAGLTWAAAAVKWGPAAEHPPARFYRTWWRWLIYRSASLRHALRLLRQSATVRFIRHAEKNGTHTDSGAADAPIAGEDDQDSE